MHRREIIGETLGTFLLVLFGCGSVAVSVLFGSHQGLMQVALAWGIGVTLSIYLTRHLSCAHLNPAVSLAMVLSGRMTPHRLPFYVVSQVFGAVLAGLVLYTLFAPSIAAFESAHQIIRGTEASVRTAMIFGEFYPNPGSTAAVSFSLAVAGEALGTFLLVLMIFALTEGCNVGRPDDALAPVFIGLTVTSIICLIAPLTQAGLNPARDFGPRMVAWIMGWGDAAFPDRVGGFFHVYVLAPLAGGVLASQFFVRVLEPAMAIPVSMCGCEKNNEKETVSITTRLIMVGGFLGAGKTTLLWEAARRLTAQGHSVGLITNDQAPDLVDTAFLSQSGAGIREVAGSCFCCNFGGFFDAVQSLIDQKADIIIAEPVGSCADLSATIMQPLKDKHPEIDLAPLTVLVDPDRVREVLQGKDSLIHPSASYILRLQMEESDRILLNKIDALSAVELQSLTDLLRQTFPKVEIGTISARSGEGIDHWLSSVRRGDKAGTHIVEVDYDRYAEGEAVLGWLNAVIDFKSTYGQIEWTKHSMTFLEHLHEAFIKHNAEIGHVKLVVRSNGGECMMNLTRLEGGIERRGENPLSGAHANLILNARVQMPPERLEKIVRTTLGIMDEGISTDIRTLRCLMPGRPNPTYRYTHTV